MLVSLYFYHTTHYDCQDFHNHESSTCLKFVVRVIVSGIMTLLQFRIWIHECTFELFYREVPSHFTLHVCQQRLCQVTCASLCSLGNTNFSLFNVYSLLLVLLHCSLADCNWGLICMSTYLAFHHCHNSSVSLFIKSKECC